MAAVFLAGSKRDAEFWLGLSMATVAGRDERPGGPGGARPLRGGWGMRCTAAGGINSPACGQKEREREMREREPGGRREGRRLEEGAARSCEAGLEPRWSCCCCWTAADGRWDKSLGRILIPWHLLLLKLGAAAIFRGDCFLHSSHGD
ncbi:uncharacterized protein [Triticum aestivum]|uniref:uncharacterized protein isoform X2 n=1 Tax=Triticum aestivum TaxID=4565 RepID=UPI001D01A637|nr:uncharacterized protein LOC123158038 isoform X2 [Triticum aestivum]